MSRSLGELAFEFVQDLREASEPSARFSERRGTVSGLRGLPRGRRGIRRRPAVVLVEEDGVRERTRSRLSAGRAGVATSLR